MNPFFSAFSSGNGTHRGESHRNRSVICHGVHNEREFMLVLQRERLRADRRGEQTSAAEFDLGDQKSAVLRFARMMRDSSRMTDEIGLLHGTRVCAALPETSSVGARAFARRIQELAAREGLRVTWTVYAYPMDQEQSMESRQWRPSPEIDSCASTQGAPGGTGGEDRRAMVHNSASSGALISDTKETVLPMEHLLRQPTPLWKRSMDIVGAVVGLTVFFPIMVISAALIRLASRGPVIFQQRRAGLFGRPFTIYKFRTMTPDAEQQKQRLRQFSEQDGPAFKMSNDPRVTLIGRLLRTTSLDELPQFFNVLVGNMSLVGPRPLPVEEANACVGWQRHRMDVAPGLTCIWQVRGRSQVKFDDWMRMDMEYIRHRSPLRDLAILLLTIPAVILRRGAH